MVVPGSGSLWYTDGFLRHNPGKCWLMGNAGSKKTTNVPAKPDRNTRSLQKRSPASGARSPRRKTAVSKKAPESLPESEAILRSFFDSAGVMRGIVEVVADDDVRHITDNAVTAAFIGLTPEAMKNKLSSELGEPKEILRMWVGRYRESRKRGKPVTFEYLDKRGDTEGWLLATVSYLGTPPGGSPRFAYAVLDISERKRAEEALREAHTRNAAILQQITDTFYSLDRQWRFTVVNPAAEKAPFGRPASELLGRVIWDLYPALVGTRIYRHYLDAAEKQSLEHYEARSPLNGQWYEVFMQGRKDGVDVFMRDITVRKETEEALRESEERFRVIAETSPVLLSVSSLADGTVLFTNPAYNRAFGYRPGEITGMPAADRFYDPAERSAYIDTLRETGEIRDREVRVMRKDGTPFWISASLARIRFGGIEAMLGASVDITERKKAEKALRESEKWYRTIADFTFDWEFWIDPVGRFVYISPSAERILGRPVSQYTSAESLFCDVTHPDDLDTMITHIAQERAGQGPFSMEFRIVRPDGRVCWIHHVCRPVLDAEGKFLGTRGSNRDVTERKLADEALLKARDELEVRVGERTAELKEALESVSTERHRLYDVLEALPVYVCLLDADYRMPFANRYFRKTFKEPEGRRCYEFLFKRSEPCETCETYTAMKTHKTHHWFWTGPNGRDYDIYDFPFTDSDGSYMILEMGIDITEQKKAEKALQEANAYNRSLIEASLDPLVTISTDGTISDVNEATIRITGLSREELIGTDFSDYFTEPAKAKAGYEKVFRDGSVTDFALDIRHRNGSVTPVLYNASVYRDALGKVIGVFASARDITERKKAEEALRKTYDLLEVRVKDRTAELVQSNVRLRAEIKERGKAESTLRETSQYLENLINYANAPIIVWDPEFRITLFNHAFEHLTDRAAAEVIGKPLDILLPKGCLGDVMERIRKTVTGERWESVEIPILHKNGEIRTVLWNSSSIYGADGKTIVSIIAQGQDITDRKKIESEYRLRASEYAKMNLALEEEIRQRKESDATLKKTLSLLNASLESTADGICVVDQQGRITGYNQNFISMWDIPSGLLESGENEKVMNSVLPQLKDPKGFLASIRELQSNPGRESFDMIEFNDGKIFERYSKPQKIGDSVVGRVWSYRDSTDRKHAEEKLVASLQEKEVLLREIHHRVKNNLQLISGLLDMTRMRTGDESTNEILTDMMLKIQTMAQIHTRLYESKQFGKVSMTGQIRDQIAGLSNIYSHKGHEISCEIHSDEIFLPVDQAIPCALVINEILSNAYKHAFRGRKKGAIGISVMEENGRISITVRDNGIGLPADFDISRSNSLGLKLIRTLVSHQLKGSFTIRSQDGTEMSMEFPVVTAGT